MKKKLFIAGGVMLVCLWLVVRLFFKQNDSFTSEREWFVKALRYEFTAQVDSIHMLNKNTGRLYCHLTSGNPQVHREDSLKHQFKEHDMLYLIFKRSGDSIVFLAPSSSVIKKGDSVRVSSEENSVQFFRDGTLIAKDDFTNTLTGFGKPFFLK